LKPLPFVAAILCAALLTGCTATFTYNHLDRLIPWYVDGYVDLTREQRRLLDAELEPLLRWHREEELLRYHALLQRIEKDTSADVSPAQVRAWIDELMAALERVETSMLSLALEFSSTLSDEQMAEFGTSLWERQREYEKEFLGRSEKTYRRDSYDELADLLRRFTGPLEPVQERRLRRAADDLRRFDSAWLEEREIWLHRLEPLLQRKPGWQQDVRDAYAARREQRTPRYREYLAHNLEVVSAAIADVLNQLTAKQRTRLARELDELQNRILELSSRSRVAGRQSAAAACRMT
jgi:hypothetical protein